MPVAGRTAPRVYGRPGAHASSLVRRHGLFAALAAAGTAAALYAAASLDGRMGVAALIVAVVAAVAARHHWGRLRRADVGVRAERKVARALRKVPAAAVVHGARIGAGDADHVVLGPQAVVVETKSGRGKVSLRGGEMTVGGRRLPRDPVRQARGQAAALRKKTGVYTDTLVCVPDASSAPQTAADGTTVCNARDLPQVIAGLPHRISPAQAGEIAARL